MQVLHTFVRGDVLRDCGGTHSLSVKDARTDNQSEISVLLIPNTVRSKDDHVSERSRDTRLGCLGLLCHAGTALTATTALCKGPF